MAPDIVMNEDNHSGNGTALHGQVDIWGGNRFVFKVDTEGQAHLGEPDPSIDGIESTGFGDGRGVFARGGEGGGTGVYGESEDGIGVFGTSARNSGVHGEHTGPEGPGFVAGVRGFARTVPGVVGQSTGAGMAGVRGIGVSVGVTGTGGETDEHSGQVHGRGVEGSLSGANPLEGPDGENSAGVFGTAYALTGGPRFGIGVKGLSKDGIGVYGRSTDGRGVLALSENGDGVEAGSVGGDGVVGSSAFGIGVRGESQDDGLFRTNAGVQGNSPKFTGVWGTTKAGVGVRGQAEAQGFAGAFSGRVFVNGRFIVAGAGNKHAAVKHPDGSHRLLYSQESTECWLEDFGKGELIDGHAEVALDFDFAALIDADGYHVFLAPYGDSSGLYVADRSADGFEVREQGGGTSNLTFSYRLVAKPKDADVERLAEVTMPQHV